MARRIGRIVTTACMVLAAWPGVLAAQPALEYEVKAAYLANFLKFVQWPPAVSGLAEPPAAICIVGRPAFAPVVEKAVAGQTVDGRPLTVRLVMEEDVDDRTVTGPCRVIFVARAAAQATPLLARAHPSGVLLVGESPRFLADGGHIQLVVDAGKVHFDLNLQGAQATGLTISSRLARLARNAVGLQHR